MDARQRKDCTCWRWMEAVFTSVTLSGYFFASSPGLVRSPPVGRQVENFLVLVFFFLKSPWLNYTDALLWSSHPFLNEAQAKVPERKRKALLACSLSSFCSHTIMHIVCTAPPTHTSTPTSCLQPSLSCGFSFTRSRSFFSDIHTHTHLVRSLSLCHCYVNRSDSGRRACESPVA